MKKRRERKYAFISTGDESDPYIIMEIDSRLKEWVWARKEIKEGRWDLLFDFTPDGYMSLIRGYGDLGIRLPKGARASSKPAEKDVRWARSTRGKSGEWSDPLEGPLFNTRDQALHLDPEEKLLRAIFGEDPEGKVVKVRLTVEDNHHEEA